MTIHLSNVIECLRELSDIEFQRRVWVDGSGPDVSSFEELICQLFDDTGLDDAIESGAARDELGEEIATRLQDLDSAIARIDRSLSADLLVEHPAMEDVRQLASTVLSQFEKQA